MEQSEIVYIDRLTRQKNIEKVYGASALQFLYGSGLASLIFGKPLLQLIARWPFFSKLYGYWQKLPFTKGKILPFIQKYHIDQTEFLQPVDAFASFNDFFIRKLKNEARPIVEDDQIAIMPADARYLFFQNIDTAQGFLVKGAKFTLKSLLNDEKLAAAYENGSMVIARLCPTDYHRFHFPVDCTPGTAQLINGWLYSVNPIALKKNIEIFTQNKRAITSLQSNHFGKVLFIEIGATNVGSIIQTYQPEAFAVKGAEKGYFSFGASSIILLFPPNSIEFDSDLLAATEAGFEIRCLFGQSMGVVAKLNSR